MSPSSVVRRPRGAVTTRVLGGLVSIAVAVALYTRFDIDGALSRDEAIYAYGGQQLAHGVPPYASIFDPKAPLATMIAGAAAWLARLLARSDIAAIRGAFFLCAVLTVLAVYLLAVRLFGSVLAGLTAAVVLSAAWPFAVDALSGPDAKTPGVLFAVVSMWLLSSRRWFWGAFAGGLAFLVWQPLLFYPLVAVLVPLLTTPRRRWRSAGVALAGAAIPVVVVTGYFTLAGALGKFLESALVFPLTGIKHGNESVGQRLGRIAGVVDRYYGMGGALFWAGLVLLLLLVVVHLVRGRSTMLVAFGAPLVSVVLLTLLLDTGYAATDFQSYPDLYPFLPYPALGLGGAAATLVAALRPSVARVTAGVAVVVALAVLTVAAWVSFSDDPAGDPVLRDQRASGCAVRRSQVPGTPIWSLGDPAVLVITHRRNPDRFIYLGSAVDRWKVAHTPGGFAGWTRQITRAAPSVLVIKGWAGPERRRMGTWLRGHGYRTRFAGPWHLFLTPAALARASQHGVRLTRVPTKFAAGPGGRELFGRKCG
jgi:MFS family permease